MHRRNKFKASPKSIETLEKKSEEGLVKIETPYQLDCLNGKNGYLKEVQLKNLEGKTKVIKTDFLLPFYGLSMDLGPIINWELNLDKKHILIDQSTCSTNISGIFAIGDIATYKGKLKLILTGFAEAAHAAYSARSYLKPEEVFHFEYSTNKNL